MSEFEMVVPFIACVSKGGPYEDEAFVAGFQSGLISLRLQMGARIGADHIEAIAYSELADQIDLLAMQHGYSVEPTTDGPWTTYRFSLSPVDV